MRNWLFTVSHPKHFHWLRVALRSIAKYGTGWDGWQLCLPRPHTPEVDDLLNEYQSRSPGIPLEIHWFDEWPEKGKLHHMALILEADSIRREADAFWHWDSDTVMTAPLDVSEFFRDGKPMWGYAPFSDTIRALPPVENWKNNAERALGWKVEFDFMRWFPICTLREVLLETRQCIMHHTCRPWKEFIREQENTFPEGFAEYNTIGPVAWSHYHDRYAWNRTPVEGLEDGRHTPGQLDGWPAALAKTHKAWGWKPVGADGEGQRLIDAGILRPDEL